MRSSPSFSSATRVPGDAHHTEIHACQPLGLDKVMFVENGLPPKLKVINIKTGAVEVDDELPFEESRGVHGQFRRARVTAQGACLIPFLSMDRVVEYDKNFRKFGDIISTSPERLSG